MNWDFTIFVYLIEYLYVALLNLSLSNFIIFPLWVYKNKYFLLINYLYNLTKIYYIFNNLFFTKTILNKLYSKVKMIKNIILLSFFFITHRML